MSQMLLHELHPAVVHAPIALLPAACVVDLLGLATDNATLQNVGRALWSATAATGVVAAVAGLAASQEVRMDEPAARDMAFLHGVVNAAVTGAAVGMALYRRKHRPTGISVVSGLTALGGLLYSASLGGRLVYQHGVGVTPMSPYAPNGATPQLALLSAAAPAALLSDALDGLRWLVRRMGSVLQGREPLEQSRSGLTQPASPLLTLPPPLPGLLSPRH